MQMPWEKGNDGWDNYSDFESWLIGWLGEDQEGFVESCPTALMSVFSQVIRNEVSKVTTLSKKHKGMRVDHSGILGRIAQGCKVRQDQRYILGEMDKHLEEMAERFYNGDIKAVDEFLQLYCLDDHRPVSAP